MGNANSSRHKNNDEHKEYSDEYDDVYFQGLKDRKKTPKNSSNKHNKPQATT